MEADVDVQEDDGPEDAAQGDAAQGDAAQAGAEGGYSFFFPFNLSTILISVNIKISI